MIESTVSAGLRTHDWRLSYRTSGTSEAGYSLDILREFYIPALEHAVRYERVAGYFRSSSLAAASQGFSAFIGHQGSARFVVGADLDPGDVRAILAGDEARLAAILNETLKQPEAWPTAVEQGVELLSWMVARGRLELKVALRVHRATGAPLPFGSVDDGYVHMKWGLLADGFANRIYFSGSLNESRQALVHNAENIDVHCDWRNDDARRRADEAESEFTALWENRNPALRVLTLPEAVRQRLIAIGERFDDPHPALRATLSRPAGEGKRPSALERLRFALLRDGPRLPGGRFVGMATAPVAPWPHQAVVARRLIEDWPYSYLLCDEVGLGKTIEAGLAIRSLYLSGLVRRVMIAPPASLTQQWHREMALKFLLPFARALGGASRHAYLLPVEEERPSQSLYEPDLTIVSTGLMSRAERRRELERAQAFDVALVDEAHYARRKNPQEGTRGTPEFGRLYQTIETVLRPKSHCLWLASATPMQLDRVEAFDLLRLTRRGAAFSQDPGLAGAYYELLGKLIQRQSLREGDSRFLRRAVRLLQNIDPVLWGFLKATVCAGPSRVTVERWLGDGREPRGRDAEGIRRLVFAAAPLSQVMLRHTRSLLEIYRDHGKLTANLAEREILPLRRITFNDQERRVYGALERYCRGLAQCLSETARNGRGRAAIGFYLSFLRLRFASSLYAVRETLKRRFARVEATLACHREHLAEPLQQTEELVDLLEEAEDDQEVVTSLLERRTPQDLLWERDALRAMLNEVGDLSIRPSKVTELLRVLNCQRRRKPGRIEQTVVFTRFYDTLTDVVQRLQAIEPEMLLGTYSGHGGQYYDPEKKRLVNIGRDEVKQRFLRGEIDVLICTDAAAEGLNLQTANLLMNFDLPWNPMKVEQRIGRIDRIGQRHARVCILNLCYAGSAEETVYGRLLERLREARLIVGTQQLALLPVTQEEFAELADGTLSEQELERRARERAERARQRTASMEIPAKDLYAIYTRLEQHAQHQRVPMGLEAIWDALSTSEYLLELGCQVMPDAALKALSLAGLAGIGKGSVLTVDRAAFETGIPGTTGKLHFASYGDPVFTAIFERFACFGLPSCVRRLEVTAPGIAATMVGFAVAARTGSETTTVKLITAYDELQGLILDETAILQDSDVEALRNRLQGLAEQEFSQTQTLRWVEELNEKVGRSQLLLSLMVAKGLLEGRQRLGMGLSSFPQEMAAITERVEETPVLRVTGLSTQIAKTLVHPLFEMGIPAMQPEMHLDAPRPLLLAAVDAMWRAANALHGRRSELSTAAVIVRLEREISGLLKGVAFPA
jgi:hypothetical protein